MSTLERLMTILVAHYQLDPKRIESDTPLEQLGIDSLGMVELLFFIEDEFKLQLPSDAPLLPTVADAVRYIDALQAQQARSTALAGEVSAPPPQRPA